ncbi:hypothetical protein M011DRAFT_452146 [Sporormia fimetaria CBS 119925]|uniref:Uncharacterized protein n=1 Tax=Sporormia fimetaria CBS 119925 TaxID=1340428 RepID=A0A6A6UZ95_9PLEO|nr:hypothetical protein M011DRAFT_452146 [Sporormia fimetaria CBS 119925]
MELIRRNYDFDGMKECEGPAGMEVPFMDLGWFSGMSVRVLCTGGDIKTVKSRLSEKDIVD